MINQNLKGNFSDFNELFAVRLIYHVANFCANFQTLKEVFVHINQFVINQITYKVTLKKVLCDVCKDFLRIVKDCNSCKDLRNLLFFML